ncbi:MAG: molybdopterin molybdotransferase MoeA [Gammaproteobacteria bacterium]|nr:molybdopterin molybdotransferase MoeA [Gammaproteobacteria bacterium]
MDLSCPNHDLNSVEETLDRLLLQASPVIQTEVVSLLDADNRILAKDLIAVTDIPTADTSAMDGYAVRSTDLSGQNQKLKVGIRLPAGSSKITLEPGCAARIFTGAILPTGADAVVMQEYTRTEGDQVLIDTPVTPGQNVRPLGCHVQRNMKVIARGARLRTPHLALAASIGVDHLEVTRRLRVALLSNGDELIAPGNPLPLGKIYNANPYGLQALLKRLNCEVIDYGVIPDRLDAVRDCLLNATQNADLILSNGGMSVGEEDHLRDAVSELGEIALWRVRIKPGKPFAFGRVANTPFIGLPGNPVSAIVTFCLFVRPYLLARQGCRSVVPAAYRAQANFDISKPPERDTYLAVYCKTNSDGQSIVRPHPNQDSAALIALAETDGFAVVPAGKSIANGDPIRFIPFRELMGE